jgi:hypothetical protein
MKITRFVREKGGASASPDWPWWTLVEAVAWIVGEEGYSPPRGSMVLIGDGDSDYSAREWAAKELRIALAQGRVTAHGLRSYSEKPERIGPVEWTSRQVPITKFARLKSWLIEPYSEVVVAKDEIKRTWPVPLALQVEEAAIPRSRGRPLEYDWDRILAIAAEERKHAPSARKLEMIVQARCRDELGYPEGKPVLSSIRAHLKRAQ